MLSGFIVCLEPLPLLSITFMPSTHYSDFECCKSCSVCDHSSESCYLRLKIISTSSNPFPPGLIGHPRHVRSTSPRATTSLEISKELDTQNKMLDNVNVDLEEAIGGLDAVTRKTKELIKKAGTSYPFLSRTAQTNR